MTFEGSTYVSIPRPLSMLVDHWDAVLPEKVFTRLTRQRPNILLVGPAVFTDAALRLIVPLVQGPVAWWMPQDKHAIPTGALATLFIAGVNAAEADQQRQLCIGSTRVQIASKLYQPRSRRSFR
jgi:hypothetical protein